MSPRLLANVAAASLFGLILLCVLWEAWLAPLRPGGSWMMLKAVPLLLPLFGILHGRRYTYQYTSMLVLLYFTEGVLRASDGGRVTVLALIEVALSVLLFFATILYARNTAPSRQGGKADKA